MKIIITILILLFIYVRSLYSQPFNPQFDEQISQRTIYNESYNVNETLEYGTHWFAPTLIEADLNKKSYLSNLFSFVISMNSKIVNFYIDTTFHLEMYNNLLEYNVNIMIIPEDYSLVGSCTIRLSDTMDAYNYYDEFMNSGYFQLLDFFPVGHTNSFNQLYDKTKDNDITFLLTKKEIYARLENII